VDVQDGRKWKPHKNLAGGRQSQKYPDSFGTFAAGVLDAEQIFARFRIT
jgi:hypothetical protein